VNGAAGTSACASDIAGVAVPGASGSQLPANQTAVGYQGTPVPITGCLDVGNALRIAIQDGGANGTGQQCLFGNDTGGGSSGNDHLQAPAVGGLGTGGGGLAVYVATGGKLGTGSGACDDLSQASVLGLVSAPVLLGANPKDRFGTQVSSAGNSSFAGLNGTSSLIFVPGGGSSNSNGNAKVQTFAWASWVQPGIYARPDGGTDWALQDIHALSHEIAEWGDDPFVNNTVEPWVTPTAPQYGCTGLLETGDPVVAIGFAMGTNTFEQTGNPDGTNSADGFYHPEDEALLPWFMRTAPNTVSEPTQSPSTNIGRYTFMGDLNPFSGFRAPATGC